MMDIVKKNLISIICGVVALAAVGVAFTMLTTKQGELQKELDGRKQVYDQLNGLLTKPGQLPVLDPEKPEPKPLTKFPNEKTILEGGKLTKGVEEEAKKMAAAAVQINKHAPLVQGSLPEPSSTAGYMFREQYLQYFPQPTGAAGGPVGPGGVPAAALNNSRFAAELHAGMPPTAEEIRQKQDEVSKEITSRSPMLNGQLMNQQAVTNQIAERTRKIPDEMRAAVANNCKVYINPTTFTGWATILAQPGQPDPVDIFGAQLTLWIQEDVIGAVNDANKASKNIRDAVVKHLKSVVIMNPNPVLPPGATTPGTDADAEIKPDKAVSPTGRVSNGMYDVYRVTVDADVEAAKLPEYLRAFGQNRFMTPLWADVKSVDNAVELGAGHDYGRTSMVNVRAECEVLFLRQWCRPLMPRKIREKLGLPPEEPAPPPTEATTAPAADGSTPTTAPAATPAAP